MFVHGSIRSRPIFPTETIALLRDTFLFWRISKGGPGLPEEGGPWDTAMPAWEKFLKEDEIWDVILFLYDSPARGRARGKEVATNDLLEGCLARVSRRLHRLGMYRDHGIGAREGSRRRHRGAA
jgi:hypothetical protein